MAAWNRLFEDPHRRIDTRINVGKCGVNKTPPILSAASLVSCHHPPRLRRPLPSRRPTSSSSSRRPRAGPSKQRRQHPASPPRGPHHPRYAPYHPHQRPAACLTPVLSPSRAPVVHPEHRHRVPVCWRPSITSHNRNVRVNVHLPDIAAFFNPATPNTLSHIVPRTLPSFPSAPLWSFFL